MVNNEMLDPNLGMDLIKKLFSLELPNFKLIDSKNMGYYYAQTYEYGSIPITPKVIINEEKLQF